MQNIPPQIPWTEKEKKDTSVFRSTGFHRVYARIPSEDNAERMNDGSEAAYCHWHEWNLAFQPLLHGLNCENVRNAKPIVQAVFARSLYEYGYIAEVQGCHIPLYQCTVMLAEAILNFGNLVVKHQNKNITNIIMS